MKIFHLFILGKIEKENVFDDVLHRQRNRCIMLELKKNACENRCCKTYDPQNKKHHLHHPLRALVKLNEDHSKSNLQYPKLLLTGPGLIHFSMVFGKIQIQKWIVLFWGENLKRDHECIKSGWILRIKSNADF